MDFYIIIVPALVLSLCMILNLLILKRRDKYLFAELQQGQDIKFTILEKSAILLSDHLMTALSAMIRDNSATPLAEAAKKNTIEEQRDVFSKS